MWKSILFVALLLVAGLLQANPIPSSSLELWFNEEDKSVEMYYHLLQDYNYDSETGESSSDWASLPVTHAVRLKCYTDCFSEGSFVESAYELRADGPLVVGAESSSDPCVAPGSYLYLALDDFPYGYYGDSGVRNAWVDIPGEHSCPKSGIRLCMEQAVLDEIKSSGRADPEDFAYCDDDEILENEEDPAEDADYGNDDLDIDHIPDSIKDLDTINDSDNWANDAPAISDTDEAVPDTDEKHHSSAGCSIVTI